MIAAAGFGRMQGWVRSPWWQAITGLIFPNWCQICRENRATSEMGYVCAECLGRVRPLRPPFCRKCGLPFYGAIDVEFTCANCLDADLRFDQARAAVIVAGPVREAIHRYKYRQALWFEPFLARLLISASDGDEAIARCDGLVPVPLHATRRRERGFNQAERLACALGAHAGKPVWTDLVHRGLATETQTAFGRTGRRRNMTGAFEPAGRRLKGASVVVVDDIFTTGATTSAVAAVLRRAGASRVAVWTVARATLGAPSRPPEPAGAGVPTH